MEVPIFNFWRVLDFQKLCNYNAGEICIAIADFLVLGE